MKYISSFIADINTRFLAVMFKVYSVYGDNYIYVICGIEMTQYFSHLNFRFIPTTFNKLMITLLFLLDPVYTLLSESLSSP